MGIKRTVLSRLFLFCPGTLLGLFLCEVYMSGRRAGMQRAKNTKNDEFYTQYQDIAAECDHYLDQFRNKVIYCNCDTECSNFVRYFLNLKSQGIIRDVIWSGGLGGIDFRSPESVAMLQQADVVVTNPPFSLFRQYVAQLIESDKQFLILGNQNAVSYKDFFLCLCLVRFGWDTNPLGRCCLTFRWLNRTRPIRWLMVCQRRWLRYAGSRTCKHPTKMVWYCPSGISVMSLAIQNTTTSMQ